MKENPLVYIIVLNWKSYTETIECIRSLENLHYQPIEILIVDNCSPDGSGKLLKRSLHNYKVIITNSNLGYAGGNNIGIEYAIEKGAAYIWILNPDIRVEPKALARLVESMGNNPNIGAIGPRICERNDNHKIFTDGGLIFPKEGYRTSHKHYQNYTSAVPSSNINLDINFIDGSAILLRSDTIKQLGMFREDFFLYFEETEWCMRCKKQGWILATNTSAVVYHTMSKQGATYHYYMTRNRIWIAKINNSIYLNKTILYEFLQILKYLSRPTVTSLFYTIPAKFLGLCSGICRNPQN